MIGMELGALEHCTFGLTFPPASCPPWGCRLETTTLSMEEMSIAALHGLEEEFGPLLWLLQDQNWEKERKGGLTLFT